MTLPGASTTGNCLVVFYRGSNSASLVCTATGATFTTVEDGASSGIAIAVAPNITGQASPSIACAVTSHSNPGYLIVMEVSAIASSSPTDDADEASGFVSNISLNLTTTVNNTFLIGAMFSGAGGATAGAGFTLRHEEAGSFQVETGIGATSGTNAVGFVHSERTANLSAIALKPS